MSGRPAIIAGVLNTTWAVLSGALLSSNDSVPVSVTVDVTARSNASEGPEAPKSSVNPEAESVFGTTSMFQDVGGASRGRHVPATQAPPPHWSSRRQRADVGWAAPQPIVNIVVAVAKTATIPRRGRGCAGRFMAAAPSSPG